MAEQWVTGWEHGVSPVANGGGLADAVVGSPTVQSSVVRSGTYALQCGGASAQGIRKTLAGTSYKVGRIYFNKTRNSGSNWWIVECENSGDYTSFKIGLNSDGDVFAQVSAGTIQTTSPQNDDEWIRVDFRMYAGASTGTIDWQVDGVAQTQATGSITSGLLGAFRVGDPYNVFYGAGEYVYFEDLIVSDDSSKYPYGAGEVVGLRPIGDGTHDNSANTIKDNDGNVIDGSTYYAWNHVDKVPLSESSVYLQQDARANSEYVEVTFAISGVGSINGAMGLLAYNSAGTAVNSAACFVVDSESTETDIWGNLQPDQEDYSETDFFYKSAPITEPSGGWDEAEIDALLIRMGGCHDYNPVPYWRNVMIEVDYVPTLTQTLSSVGAIASGEAFGTLGKLNLRIKGLTGIPSAEAFGVAARLNHRIRPSAIGSLEDFGSPQLNFRIRPSAIGSLEDFGAHLVYLSDQYILSAGNIASLEAFGAHEVILSAGDQTLIPSAIASLEAFGNGKLNFRIKGLTGIPSAEAFGNGKLNFRIRPSAIASLESFGSPQLNLQLRMNGIASLEAFGAALVYLSDQYIIPSAIASLEAFGSHTVTLTAGDQTIIPSAIASLEAFGAALVYLSDQYIIPSAIGSLEAFGAAQLNLRIFPAAIGSAEVFGTPRFGISISPSGIVTAEAFGTPQLDLRIFPAGIITGEAFGATVVILSDQYILPNGIASLEAFGATVVSLLYGESVFPILFDFQKDGIFGLNKTTVFNLTKDNVFLFGQGNRKK